MHCWLILHTTSQNTYCKTSNEVGSYIRAECLNKLYWCNYVEDTSTINLVDLLVICDICFGFLCHNERIQLIMSYSFAVSLKGIPWMHDVITHRLMPFLCISNSMPLLSTMVALPWSSALVDWNFFALHLLSFYCIFHVFQCIFFIDLCKFIAQEVAKNRLINLSYLQKKQTKPWFYWARKRLWLVHFSNAFVNHER